jgi:hypothetical protein
MSIPRILGDGLFSMLWLVENTVLPIVWLFAAWLIGILWQLTWAIRVRLFSILYQFYSFSLMSMYKVMDECVGEHRAIRRVDQGQIHAVVG